MTEFNIGDKVKILIDAIEGEHEGIITEVDDGSTEKMGIMTYLVRTPSGYIMWLGKENMKLISMGKEKVIFT